MPRQTQVKRIIIQTDTKGDKALKRIANEMASLNRNTKNLSSGFTTLTRATLGYFGVLQVRELINLSDRIQLLNDRIKVLGDGVTDSRDILESLRVTAARTQASIDDTAETYSRLAAAIGGTGVSAKFLTQVTEVLQGSFLVAGSSAKEMTSTVVQLAQAFASGEVRGQELRSVVEQNAVVARILREEYGKDIYKKAEKGAIDATSVLRLLFKNQEQILDQAKQIAPTFERTIIRAFDKLKLALLDINLNLGIAQKFADVMDLLTRKAGLLGVALGGLALVAIPSLVNSLNTALIPALANASRKLLLFAATNPILATLALSSIAVVALADDMDDLGDKASRAFYSALVGINEFTLAISKFLKRMGSSVQDKSIADAEARIERFRALAASFQKDIDDRAKKRETAEASLIPGLTEDELEAQLKKLQEFYNRTTGAVTDSLKNLNKEFGKTKDLEAYAQGLEGVARTDLELKFRDGKISLLDYNEAIRQFKLTELTREFNKGEIAVEKYSEKIGMLQLEKLNQDLATGKINLQKYNEELAKLPDTVSQLDIVDKLVLGLDNGINKFLQSSGTFVTNFANVVSNAFGRLEGELLNFVKTGKFEFSKFTQAILDDLSRIILRAAIVQPLAQGILGAVGFNLSGAGATGGSVGAPLATTTGGLAKTGAFNYQSYAAKPAGTSAGTATIPSNQGGVNVNIINNAQADIETVETVGANGERNIEVLIESKVREGLSKGTYDRQMKQNYGLSRKGF